MGRKNGLVPFSICWVVYLRLKGMTVGTMDADTQLVGSLYDAIDPEYESEFLQHLENYFDAANAGICIWDKGVEAATYSHSSLPADTIASYLPEIEDDPWIVKDTKTPRRTKALRGTDIIPQAELHMSRMYQSFMRPMDLEYMLCCATYLGSESGVFVVAHKSPTHNDFDLIDRSKMSLLENHIDRVVRLRTANGLLNHSKFDHYGPCIEVTNTLNCTLNKAAQALERQGLLHFRAGSVFFSDTDLQSQFKRAVNDYFFGRERLSADLGEILRDRSGSVSIYLLGETHAVTHHNKLLVFVQCTLSHYEYIRAAGATREEASLGDALVRGLTLAEHAKQCNKSIHTVRSQCKSLFTKTRTNSQTDFVRKVILRRLE